MTTDDPSEWAEPPPELVDVRDLKDLQQTDDEPKIEWEWQL